MTMLLCWPIRHPHPLTSPPIARAYLAPRRTCLLHQKLQMLNCCVAEQNRAKALALSTRSSPVGLASPSTPTWNAPSVNAGGEAGLEDDSTGEPPVLDHERARFAGSPSPITPGRNETTGISSNDEGGGGGGSGGRGGSGHRGATGRNASPSETSAAAVSYPCACLIFPPDLVLRVFLLSARLSKILQRQGICWLGERGIGATYMQFLWWWWWWCVFLT